MRETACCQPRMARWAAGRRSASAGQLTQMAVSSAGDGSKKKGRRGQGGVNQLLGIYYDKSNQFDIVVVVHAKQMKYFLSSFLIFGLLKTFQKIINF
jgi:hypothetical protein